PDAIRSELSKPLENPGKIYIYNNYLIVCEQRKGVHIINNSNPSSPQKISFVSIPGVMDIAVKSDVLYADSYTDVVSIDLSNASQVSVLHRQNTVFAQSIFPAYAPNYPLAHIGFTKGVVIGWKVEDVKEVYEGDIQNQSNGVSSLSSDNGSRAFSNK